MRHERGFILPMVIFSLAIMGVLVLIIVGTSDDDRLGSRYDFEGTRSFYAAEAGVNAILTSWSANGYEATVPNVGNTNVLAWATLPQNGGTYRATILKVATSTYMITVDGQSPGARKGLRTVQIMLTPGPGAFTYAVQGTGNVKFSGGAGTDSYDSDVGAYGAGNIGTSGDVYSATSISQLSSGTPAPIQGDTKSLGSIAGCGATYQTGACDPNTTSPPPAPATVSCPATFTPQSDMPVNTGQYTYSGGALSVSGTTLVLPSPPTSYSFASITVSGGSGKLNFDFTTSPKQHVDVWVSGGVTVSGGAQLNNLSQEPPLLTFWGCGASTATWTLSGGSDAFFAVYAPKHPLTISGGSGFYGAFVGAAVTVSGGSTRVHYDQALSRVPSVVLIPGSWTEITR
jgi:hypothetical protein